MSSRPTYCYINSSSPPLSYWTVKVTWLLVGPVLRDRMSTEYHQHGIPYDFCNSVSSVFRAKLPKILRNFAEFCTAYLDKILSKMWFFMNRISYISKGSHLSRSSTGYCNLQICPCAAQAPLVYVQDQQGLLLSRPVQVQLRPLWCRHIQGQQGLLLSRQVQVQLRTLWCRHVQVQQRPL